MNLRTYLLTSVMVTAIFSAVVTAQPAPQRRRPNAFPPTTLLTIIRHEDERRWDDQLQEMLTNSDPRIRARAALAAGRIGDEKAVPVLSEALLQDRDNSVREMAAFALGEIEAPGGAFALVTALKDTGNPARARAIEALGKVTAAMMAAATRAGEKGADDDRLDQCKAAIVEALRFELQRKPVRDRLTVLLGLTALFRIRPEGIGSLVTKFLDDPDPSIVATTLNTMARLRLKDGNERVRQLLGNSDPIVRANAARVIGAAEHKEAFDAVLDRAVHDSDLRVRVSAIRALGSLKLANAATPLLNRAQEIAAIYQRSLWQSMARPREIIEILEISSALGLIRGNSTDNAIITFLQEVRKREEFTDPELEIAYARIAPARYVADEDLNLIVRSRASDARGSDWKQISSIARGLAVMAGVNGAATGTAGDNASTLAQKELAAILERTPTPTLAIPEVLQAYAGYKNPDTVAYALRFLQSNDVVVRATAAEVLGNQTPSEANARALIEALPRALRDQDSDDAALAILGALAKQKTAAANDAIKSALDSSNHLIRRRAVALLKANGVGDFSDRIGTVQTRNTPSDYRRAMARIGRRVTATVVTSRGSFTIQFQPDNAPLTIDNFVQLAKRGYFNGQTIPRVVPNFVIQAGDPRGDQNGGPGYTIRCEINPVLFERAAVGMALSGKDTGGSQWFVTHSPQPHLDGGYTVFGQVIRGMDVVDNISRGDVIRRVIVNER
ncbi:MAG TPA: peptidylprolyl isomerase [Pyrinomonadaceae bacterium]|nr:peptidylprolyl isomerase [Pyrinomonadaceae bacterium]